MKRVRGRGGFAEVWEADTPTGPVALKFMPSSNTATTARELRSIQSFQSLDHPFLVRTNGANLARVAALMAEGRVRSVIDSTYPLADTRAAHEKSRSWRSRGKLVLRVR